MNDEAMIVTAPTEHNHTHFCGRKSLSWTAIFAGALVGVGLSFLLNLLCACIGLSAFSASSDGATALVISGFVGLVIATFVSMYMAGWVAGYIGRPYVARRHLGELYGFITWSLALLLTVMLASHVTKFVSSFNDSFVMHQQAPAVAVTTNEAAPLASQSTVTNVNTGDSTTQTTVNAAKAVSVSAIVTFFLFFIGALASCFGGCIGMRCCRKHCHDSNCKCSACYKS
jgi:hypothetical protein